MFSTPSFSSISLATVTPSFVITGEPNFLSSTTLRPFGPSVILTASASWLTPRRIAWRDCSPCMISLAMLINSFSDLGYRIVTITGMQSWGGLQHGEDLLLPHDDVVL